MRNGIGKLCWISVSVTALAAVSAFAAATLPSTVPHYTVTPLGTLGGTYIEGRAINNRGEITGSASTAGNATTHAFVYSGGSMIDLGTLGGPTSYGNGINDSGQVVGAADTAGGLQHAFLWSGGTMIDLGTLGGTGSAAYGINSSGQITGGSSAVGNAESHAFLYSGGKMADLGTLGGTMGGGFAINDSAEVAGYATTAGDAAEHAFLFSGGKMVDLGTLGGSSSRAWGINNTGQVTGESEIAGNAARYAFIFSGGKLINLGSLGGKWSVGRDINNSGQVTGFDSSSFTGGGQARPLLYSGGLMVDLNTLVVGGPPGLTLRVAAGINDRGQIVANGCHNASGAQVCQVYRLDPLAEPSAASEIPTMSLWALGAMASLLLGAGLLGVGQTNRQG